jgi:hypothetical protein
MSTSHKNKTFATLLALLLGGLGVHRFYMRGSLDKAGLMHVASVPLCGLVIGLAPQAAPFFKVLPLVLSCLIGFVEALVIGVTPDEKWDAALNAGSGKQSNSNWKVAVLLVITMFVAAFATIATMSRTVDLLYTSGAYG